MKKLIILIGLLVTTSRGVFASKDFNLDIVTSYLVEPDAPTQVVEEISLTNNRGEVYAKDYLVELNFADVSDVSVTYPDNTPISFKLDKTDTGSLVTITFETPTIGKDKQKQFKLSYKTTDIAHFVGKIVEVSLPRVSNPDEINSYTTQINLPSSLGLPTSSHNTEFSHTSLDDRTLISVDNFHKLSHGVTLLFGEYQMMHFQLSYYLENDNINTGLTQIVLPSDTYYQRIVFDNITPAPENIKADPDGNWLATYTLEPKQTLEVIATGQALLYLKPTVPVTLKDMSYREYLKPKTHWPVNDQRIVSIARELQTPENIYQYVVDTLEYNYQTTEGNYSRKGALASLDNPANSLCQDFSDLFITLARAAGIPAREQVGYAYSQNNQMRPTSLFPEMLHSWAEYYDYKSKTWYRVDPTWGKTTGGLDYFSDLDFNHFALVTRGHDSVKPYPAGYYKTKDNSESSVVISFIESEINLKPKLNFLVIPHPMSKIGLPIKGQLEVTNLSGFAVYNPVIEVRSTGLNNTNVQVSPVSILPFSTRKDSVNFSRISPFSRVPAIVEVNLANEQPQTFQYHSNNRVIQATGLALLGFFVALGAWRLLVHLKH